MKLGVVILAAGASRRMRQPKLLLPWGNTSIIGHLIRPWAELNTAQIAVVLADDNKALKDELDRLNFLKENRIINPNPDLGMFSSIQCAANWNGWNPSLTHFVITLGDQPQVKFKTLESLAQFSEQHADKISQPSLSSRPKHPVVLPKPFFASLAFSHHKTFAEFLAENLKDIALMDSNDSGLNLDLDTPEDYVRAVKFAFRQLEF